jgi:hypothetical protein
MKNTICCLALLFGLITAAPAFSGAPTNQLGSCMVDALNGKERKQLARWIFFAIAAHPEISSFSNITQNDLDSTDEIIGKLITRLLVNDCPEELIAANRANPLAVQQSFELVGQVAVQELMNDKHVLQAVTNYSRYTDVEKINSLLAK